MGSRGARHSGAPRVAGATPLTSSARRTSARRAKREEPVAAVEVQCSDYFEALCSSMALNEAVDPRSFEGQALQTARVLGEGKRGNRVQDHLVLQVRRLLLGSSISTLQAYPEVSGGFGAQLRKMRAGMFPHLDFSHRTICDVRRPTLQEACLVVTQLVSCRVVLGREIQGPTTPKRRRLAMAAGFSASESDEGLSQELENQARTQRQGEQQRCDRWLLLLVTGYGFTQRLRGAAAGPDRDEARRRTRGSIGQGSTVPGAATRAAHRRDQGDPFLRYATSGRGPARR